MLSYSHNCMKRLQLFSSFENSHLVDEKFLADKTVVMQLPNG